MFKPHHRTSPVASPTSGRSVPVFCVVCVDVEREPMNVLRRKRGSDIWTIEHGHMSHFRLIANICILGMFAVSSAGNVHAMQSLTR